MAKKLGGASRKLQDQRKVAEGALVKRAIALFVILFVAFLLLMAGSAKIPWYVVILVAVPLTIWLTYDVYTMSKILREKHTGDEENVPPSE